jgi:hypothetical protein
VGMVEQVIQLYVGSPRAVRCTACCLVFQCILPRFPASPLTFHARPSGGMADAADSKSAEGNLVRVRLSPRALSFTSLRTEFLEVRLSAIAQPLLSSHSFIAAKSLTRA